MGEKTLKQLKVEWNKENNNLPRDQFEDQEIYSHFDNMSYIWTHGV